jgi:Chaperone of endosialidase
MKNLSKFAIIGLVASVGLIAKSASAQQCANQQTCLAINATSSAQPALSVGQGGSAQGIYVSTTGTGSGTALQAQANGVAGMFTSGTGYGVEGTSSTNDGVYGSSFSGNGIHGQTNTAYASGVYGVQISGSGYGVAGRLSPYGNGFAIYGDNVSTTGWAGNFNGRVYVNTGLQVVNTCVSGNCTSDERLKKNIQPLTNSLETIIKLRPVSFEWINPRPFDRTAGIHIGFVAQDVEKVKPEWVQTDTDGFKTINRDTLPMLMVDSIKTLKTENDALRAHDKQLEDRISVLENHHTTTSSLGGNGLQLGLGLGLLVGLGAFAIRRRSTI